MTTDLETRLTALEAITARLRTDGAQTRGMAIMADRDIAELQTVQRQTNTVITGLVSKAERLIEGVDRLTQVATDLAAGLDRHETMLTALTEGQARHEQILTEILRRLPEPPRG